MRKKIISPVDGASSGGPDNFVQLQPMAPPVAIQRQSSTPQRSTVRIPVGQIAVTPNLPETQEEQNPRDTIRMSKASLTNPAALPESLRPDFTKDVVAWLTSHGLQGYADQFLDQGFITLELCATITPRIMQNDLGIRILAHQRTLENAVQSLSCAGKRRGRPTTVIPRKETACQDPLHVPPLAIPIFSPPRPPIEKMKAIDASTDALLEDSDDDEFHSIRPMCPVGIPKSQDQETMTPSFNSQTIRQNASQNSAIAQTFNFAYEELVEQLRQDIETATSSFNQKAARLDRDRRQAVVSGVVERGGTANAAATASENLPPFPVVEVTLLLEKCTTEAVTNTVNAFSASTAVQTENNPTLSQFPNPLTPEGAFLGHSPLPNLGESSLRLQYSTLAEHERSMQSRNSITKTPLLTKLETLMSGTAPGPMQETTQIPVVDVDALETNSTVEEEEDELDPLISVSQQIRDRDVDGRLLAESDDAIFETEMLPDENSFRDPPARVIFDVDEESDIEEELQGSVPPRLRDAEQSRVTFRERSREDSRPHQEVKIPSIDDIKNMNLKELRQTCRSIGLSLKEPVGSSRCRLHRPNNAECSGGLPQSSGSTMVSDMGSCVESEVATSSAANPLEDKFSDEVVDLLRHKLLAFVARYRFQTSVLPAFRARLERANELNESVIMSQSSTGNGSGVDRAGRKRQRPEDKLQSKANVVAALCVGGFDHIHQHQSRIERNEHSSSRTPKMLPLHVYERLLLRDEAPIGDVVAAAQTQLPVVEAKIVETLIAEASIVASTANADSCSQAKTTKRTEFFKNRWRRGS